MYYAARWKIRYATKIFGIEQFDEKAAEAWEYDRLRFVQSARTTTEHTWPFQTAATDHISQAHFRSILTKNYHTIEKAMALAEPRVGFGQKSGLVDRCVLDCEAYIRRFGIDGTVATTYDVLRQYRDSFGKGYERVEQFLAAHTNLDDGVRTGGTKTFRAENIPVVDERFFETRHSIRHFGSTPVTRDAIRAAVQLAQQGTPSVCNRQPGKVYVYSSKQGKADLLALQNGNRGFGESASHILIVTSDLESFVDVGERNQCWIGGGLFAMSLVYALHAQRIATCTLNWDVLPENDKALHALARIPSSEVIVMMIAVGSYTPETQIACSERKNTDDILRFEENT